MSRQRHVGWVAAATVVAVAGGVAALAAAVGPAGVLPRAELPLHLLDLIPVALGWIVALRGPPGPVGPALAWTGAATSGTRGLELWGATAATDAPWAGSEVVAVVAPGVWPWMLVAFASLVLVFPSGLLPGRRWRVVAWAAPAAALLITVGLATPPGAQAGQPPSGWQVAPLGGGLALLLAALVGAVASLWARSLRADERTRLQLRWVLLAAIGVTVLLAASWWAVGLGVPDLLAYGSFIFGILVLVPAAVTVAILRHDLFDIDRLLGESVSWVLSTVASAGVFAAVVLLASQVLGRGSALGTTGAAFVTALALLPIHGRVHALVGRVLDRERTVVLARVRRFVEAVQDGDAEPEEVEEVLRAAVGDPQLRLLLLAPGQDGRYVTLDGQPPGEAGAFRLPLRAGGVDVGVLELGTPSARRLRRAREVARVAHLPIEVSRLRLQLRGALAEVQASRARLTHAGAEERRRLERDLHDGAQQQIVSVGMRLRSLQRRLRGEPAAQHELDAAVADLEATIAELRRLAHGVRPSRLDDGLASALHELARASPIPVELAVDDVELPDVVASTAYFVVAEAVANSLKHSGAAQVQVGVCIEGDQLRVQVRDDGHGGVHDGFGVTSMRDRVAALGGELRAEGVPGSGTVITAVVPCGS